LALRARKPRDASKLAKTSSEMGLSIKFRAATRL
jgi:hypothetical protein